MQSAVPGGQAIWGELAGDERAAEMVKLLQ